MPFGNAGPGLGQTAMWKCRTWLGTDTAMWKCRSWLGTDTAMWKCRTWLGTDTAMWKCRSWLGTDTAMWKCRTWLGTDTTMWKCRSWLGTDSNVEMQVLAWDRHSNVAGLNRSMAPKSLLIIGSPIVIDIYTNNKNICTRHSLPRTHTMTNNINMDNTIQTCLLLRFRRIYYAF